ncbi:MAG: hypothetical protein QOJ19_3848 [Acidimicrobiia bacterium]|jgi:MFS superfamily sulfate permease-like transporter|nr:hypothetical protein [Acidimicrobiia bacterium]
MGTTKSDRLHLLSFTSNLVGKRAAADIEAFVGGVPDYAAVVIDFTRVHNIDEPAVAALRRSAAACQGRSVLLSIAVVSDRVRLALMRGGLNHLAPLVDSVEQGVRSLGAPLPS